MKNLEKARELGNGLLARGRRDAPGRRGPDEIKRASPTTSA